MSGLQLLGAYLTEVVAEILRVVEEAVAEYREEAARARRENHSLRSQLRDVLLLEARAEWPRAGPFLDPLSLSDHATLTPPIFSFVPTPQVALVQQEQQRVSCSRSEESKPADVPNSHRKRTRDGPRARTFPPNGVRVKEEPEERRVNEGGERGRGGPEERGVREDERWSRREEDERVSEGEEEERRSKRGEEDRGSRRKEEERRSGRTGKDTTRVEERVRKKESERGGEEREGERRGEDTKAEEERGEGDMTERSEEGEERGIEGGEDGGLGGLEELETWIKTEAEQTCVSRTEGGAAAPPVDQVSPWRLGSPPPPMSPPPPQSPPRSAPRCPRCSDTFPSGSALLLHLQQVKKPHCCDFCCKSFSQSADLRRHLRTHTGERPHRCGYCARAFSQRGNLRRHLRVHTGERPYACHTCSRRFSDGDTLKKHQRTHN